MNKPAAKEPSMDEILSSIRQIIADDDAAGEDQPAAEAAADPVEEEALSFDIPDAAEAEPEFDAVEEEPDPLELSPEQIVVEDEEPLADMADLEAELVEDSDVSAAEDDAFDVPEIVEPAEVDFGADDFGAEEEPVMAAPLPDPDLSSDMADSLLEPATDAAVKTAFSKIGSASLGAASQLTIEAMIRDMLRPMLKGWLDENLPGMVENIVAKEIERLSRGE